jgi:hypothetical protein
MRSLTSDYPDALLAPQEPPCLSLYQPTHRHAPDNAQDPIRFKNLVRSLEESLEAQGQRDAAEALLKPLRDLGDDEMFWRYSLDGLAVLVSADDFRVYRLQRPVPELAVVADTYHTKPLLRIMQSADRFQVLALDRENVRLYEGTRDALDEVDLASGVPATLTDALGEELTDPHLTVASYGAKGGTGAAPSVHGHGARKDELDIDTRRYFLAVDKAILEHHSRPSGLPLLLAALSEYHGVFRELSDNPFLVDEAVAVNPSGIDTDDLLERAWAALEPTYLARLEALIERFGTASAQERGASDVADVANATIAGRVDTLLVEAERLLPGRVDPESGQVAFLDLDDPDVGDVLDEIGEHVLRRGGEVIVVPAERMPTDTGLAAIYRY